MGKLRQELVLAAGRRLLNLPEAPELRGVLRIVLGNPPTQTPTNHQPPGKASPVHERVAAEHCEFLICFLLRSSSFVNVGIFLIHFLKAPDCLSLLSLTRPFAAPVFTLTNSHLLYNCESCHLLDPDSITYTRLSGKSLYLL